MRRTIILHFILLLVFLTAGFTSKEQEICNNGKDDDNDGLIDLQDPDCQCHFIVNNNLLLNGSFEQYDHCPVNYTYLSDYKIISSWQFGAYLNEANYYHNLRCSYDSGIVMLHMPPALPLPDGKGFISIINTPYLNAVPQNQLIKSYVGQCLQAPLKPGEQYTLSFYAGRFRSWDNYTGKIFPFTVAIFGHKDCNAVPFGSLDVLGNGCPANYPGWVLLGKTQVTSNGAWVQSTINFTVPTDINVIEIGAACEMLPQIVDLTDSTTFLDYNSYYLDDLHLLPTKDFPFEYIHVQTGTGCSTNGTIILSAPVYPGATYQWYRDSIAIIGATNDTYQLPNLAKETYYNVLISLPGKCIASETFTAIPDGLKSLHIPTDTILCTNGNLTLANHIDGLNYSINGITDTIAVIHKPGSYSITATNSYGCQRTFNTTVTEQDCSNCKLFIPNAFTPNEDGLNDIFKARTYCNLSEFDLMIFNRWGEKVFESRNSATGWDGTFNGTKLSTGVYVYFIHYRINTQITQTVKGTITLIR